MNRLTNVELVGVAITLQQFENLCQVIGKSNQVEGLNLSRTRIKNDGAVLLSILLNETTSIKTVELEGCGIGFSGFSCFWRMKNELIKYEKQEEKQLYLHWK